MSEEKANGKIVTFYSYKGGTGRSMALANVAWILACSGKRVLIIDWDLEAPGLHRYYRPFLIDKGLNSSEGIIDFVANFSDEAIRPVESGGELKADWYVPFADITRLALSVDFEEFPGEGLIDLISPGRQGPTYATRVNSFNWQNFYDRLGGGAFLEAAKRHMREKYDYILIDSRTGVSDTAGICTVQMPDILVVCFTYNNQSIEGAAAVARSAVEGRRKLMKVTGETNFNVFPVPTRVDQSEMVKLQARQKYAWRTLGDLLNPSINRDSYWPSVEVPYVAYHSYEEILAAFSDSSNDPKNVLGAFVRLTQHLTNPEIQEFNFPITPETKLSVLLQFAETPDAEQSVRDLSVLTSETPDEEQSRRAEATFIRIPAERHGETKRIWTRLVRVSRPAGDFSRQRVRLTDFPPASHTMIRAFAQSGLLSVATEQGAVEETVEIADEALLRGWKRLRGWVEDDFDFLLWRQKLQDTVQDWESSQRLKDFLLRGIPLRIAQSYLNRHRDDLNELETEFIQASITLSRVEDPSRSASSSKAFIIRPFGIKDGIDFNAVEMELIAPALDQLGISTRTSADLIQAGNIKLDIFQSLLTADIIIADLSVNNANVFYELGIRHALRDKRTFLIQSRGGGRRSPFDLQRERYFTYDEGNPAASLDVFMSALTGVLNSNSVDSPIFMLLPDLKAQDLSLLAVVPVEFREEVEKATASRQIGDLSLLADEVQGFEWEVQGLRLIGRAQFSLRDMRGARYTWEAVRNFTPDDLEANLSLGTIYQRLGDLTRSYKMLERNLVNQKGLDKSQRAEVYALMGRNAKMRWMDDWSETPPPERGAKALRSPYLFATIETYERGFREDLSHFYSGLNALAMLTIAIELAGELPDVWAENFENDSEGERRLAALKERAGKIAAVVDLLLNDKPESSLESASKPDIWEEISKADLLFLISKRPSRVAAAYRKALVGAPDFAVDSAFRQLDLYLKLGVLKENVRAALESIEPNLKASFEKEQSSTISLPNVLFFIGPMIDTPGSTKPRFPPNMEGAAREAIRSALVQQLERRGEISLGVAGGSPGSDIIFHEVCAELNIPTQLYVPLTRGHYIQLVVRQKGVEWVERFNRLSHNSQARALTESAELPSWLHGKPDYNLWQRSNLWMFHNAVAVGGENTTVIALWDGQGGDGPGGINHILQKARAWGMEAIVIDTKEVFGI